MNLQDIVSTLRFIATSAQPSQQDLLNVANSLEALICNSLQLDADPGFKARALHRVVRSMHDGHCPKCGYLNASEVFYIPAGYRGGGALMEGKHFCPNCGFTVFDSEADAALAEFLPYLKKSVDIFEKWQRERAGDYEGI